MVDGSLILLVGACFTIAWDTGRALTLQHCTMQDAIPVPPHTPITRDFQMVDNHLDFKATLKLPPVAHLVHQFFGQQAGFLQQMYLPGKKFKGLEIIAEDVAAADQRQRAEGQVGQAAVVAATEAIAEGSKTRKAAQLVKAREILLDRKEKRKAARTVSFGAAAPAV